jgi:putative peptidoglycan binding protein
MKRTLCAICIGSLALTLTAWGQPTNNTRPDRAKAHRTANVRATRPANTGAMTGAHHHTATAPSRERTYMTARTRPNRVVNEDAQMRASRQRNFSSNRDFRARSNAAVNRDRSFAVNRARNVEVNRNRSAAEFRARNDFATNRERNVAVNRTRNFDVNRDRNTAEFRARNDLAVNRNRNFAFNRRSNVAINNNFRSPAFRGRQYAAFRNYHREWHDRGWWRSHYNRIVFVNGGWYYWNAGYWFPAWGYAPSAYYAYDGPIYGYNGLAPDRVIVDVQSQLQRDGYYDGPIDGVLGPMTREAIAAFQADHGLAVTSVIDEPTLATLGIA